MRTKDILITGGLLFTTFFGFAAPTLPDPGPEPPPGLPIDGNIWLLVALGILLAGSQLIIFRKKQKTQSKI